MTRSSFPPLDASERRDLLAALDRLEERLETTPHGLHAFARGADEAAIEKAGLPPGAAILWAKYNGLELMSGELRLHALDELEAANAEARADDLLREGDLVIGDRGRTVLVLPADPWEEGAAVVSITDEHERSPEASSVVHLVLSILGELGVLYDDYGEFREERIDEWGELEPATRRKLLRRRLDLDPLAPAPRLRLARVLRADGQAKAAGKEIEKVLHYAPEYAAAHFERGHVFIDLAQSEPARRAFAKAAEFADDSVSAAAYEAWAARSCDDPAKAKVHAAAVLQRRPDYASNQVAGARARLSVDDQDGARELVALGLAVAPTNLELLELRNSLG